MTVRSHLLTLFCVLGCLGAFPAGSAAENVEPCARLVSLAPSITETVFALGLGGNLVGVTKFCRFPPEARAVKPVGGFYDMNVELVLGVKPSAAIALRENEAAASALKRIGVEVIGVDHSRVAGIRESIRVIGKRCGVTTAAVDLLDMFAAREGRLSKQLGGVRPLKTLVVVGRLREAGKVSSVFVSGSDGFYTDMLALAGGTNVNSRSTISIPTISPEGMLALAPEAIVEIVNVDDEETEAEVRGFWDRYPALPAVKNGRILVLTDDFASIPGPRYLDLAEKLARGLHPDRFAGAYSVTVN